MVQPKDCLVSFLLNTMELSTPHVVMRTSTYSTICHGVPLRSMKVAVTLEAGAIGEIVMKHAHYYLMVKYQIVLYALRCLRRSKLLFFAILHYSEGGITFLFKVDGSPANYDV